MHAQTLTYALGDSETVEYAWFSEYNTLKQHSPPAQGLDPANISSTPGRLLNSTNLLITNCSIPEDNPPHPADLAALAAQPTVAAPPLAVLPQP